MSSRQLRKLRQQQELLALQKENVGHEAESGTEEEHAPVSIPSKPKFSGFAALAGNDDDAQDDADDAERDEPEVPEPTQSSMEEPIPMTKSKKSKKKKKKGKKVENASTENPSQVAHHELDEIDRAIQELNLAREVAAATTTAGTDNVAHASERVSQLLRINFQHLKVLNEMRRLFGKEAMETAEHEEEAQTNAPHGRRQRQHAQQQVDLETFLRGQPGKCLPEVVRRRNPFIEGKSSWPRATAGGLTMTTIGDQKANIAEYTFAHDKEYGQLETQFFFLVGMHDPQRLILFLHQNPYHISTLIQVSRVAHQDQNAALAAELCERALFTFGRVTLSSFRKNLEEGKARLNFYRPENRQFWLAGYHYIKNLIRKGTYRTALEWAKLFLSINHDDPYGMLNWIHVLAIRSREGQWFIDLCDSDLLRSRTSIQDSARYVRQTKVLAQLQVGDRSGAKASLVEGMRDVRWFYTKLFAALDVDVPQGLWGIMPPNDEDELFTDLYMHLAKDLWNNTDAISLLQEAASALARPSPNTETVMPSLVGLSTARFIYLEGKPELMGGVPRGLLHATPNFDFDPLPPAKEKNIFSNEKQKLPWTTSARPDPGDVPPHIRELLRQDPEGMEQLEALVEDQGGNDRPVDRGRLLGMLDLILGDHPAQPGAPHPQQGLIRRLLDMLGPRGFPSPGGPGDDGRLRLHIPGGFLDSDEEIDEEFDEDEAQAFEEAYGDELDDELDVDDLVDDFGDQHDDDDE